MNQQWNGGNSFMEGIDAGNRLFESIAEVEQRKIATQAATQELPLRLMQLQTANEQVRQQMDIRTKAAPLELENLKLSGLESELQIQQHRYTNSVRESEILDQDKISDAQARWAHGDMAQPDLSTVRGNQIWQEWSSQNSMKKALDSDLTSFRTSASTLKGDQRAEIMAIHPLPSGAPSPEMWKKLGEFQKKNEQDAVEEKRNTYKFQQDEVEDRMLKVQKSKNDAALARASSTLNSEFGSHKDPMIRSAFIAGSRAINDDPSADSETKLARFEKLRSDLNDPNYGKTKLSYGAQSQLRAIDSKIEGLAKQQADLFVTDPTGKNKKVQQQIRDIDSQIGILEGKKGELSGSVKEASGDGIIDYDPETRGLNGGYQNQGPEYIPALDSKKGTDAKGSIIAKTKTEAGVEKEYVFPTPKGIDDFVKMIRKMPTNQGFLTDGHKNLRRDEALLDSGRAAFYEEYAEMFDIQKEQLGDSRLYKSSRSIAKERVEKDYKEAERLINALPEGAKAEFWKNVADRITKKPFNKINGRFPWVFDWSHE